MFSVNEKANFISNLSAPLSKVRPDIREAMLVHFYKIHKDYGSRLERACAALIAKREGGTKPKTPEFSFEYFPAHGRGAPIRMLAFYTKQENFLDKVTTFPEFMQNKAGGKYPYGQLPVLVTSDGKKFAQTFSILRYLAQIWKGPDG